MTQSNIRNFAIIAHIDHGKSTLADRFLELTNTVPKEKLSEQYLDQSKISKDRGITIKLAPVRMNYTLNAIPYTLNLIDTPGHVDFSYEVSRTLAACEGAILLVDATQGIQAQTVAHYQIAKKENLAVIPVINKIDLPNAQTDVVTKELVDFGFREDEILSISAKTGENVASLLERIVEKIPSPKGNLDATLRALIFDAVYDEFRGVIAYCRIVDGKVEKADTITLAHNHVATRVADIGYFSPQLTSSSQLAAGEIGYIFGSIKDIKQVRVGDTILSEESTLSPLPGYRTPKPMVFFGVYPKNTKDFPKLRDSLEKLTLNDTALSYTEEYSSYLGAGFRIGFLGLLHAEIVKDRLQQEFGLELLLTMPQVHYEKNDGALYEPYMLLTIYAPKNYVGAIMTVCQKRKGVLLDMQYHQMYVVLTYEIPFGMFIRGLVSDMKSVSAGFASIDYEFSAYKKADVAKLEILINDNAIDVLSELVYKDEAYHLAKEKARKLKDSLPRQQFRQIIQATVDSTIISREEIPPYRKDVLAKMSGGDRTRKDKLLEAQKKGKKRMVTKAKVQLPQEALYSLLKQ